MSKKANSKEQVEKRLKVLETWPVAAWKWPKVCVCVPQFPALPHADDVFYNFWAIAQQGTPCLRMPYGRVDMVRNKAGVGLLSSPFTHILMLDADHIHPEDIVQRLCKWVILDPKMQVIGGMNFRRGEPYDPCCFIMGANGKFYPPSEWDPGLIEVDAIGTGSILIAREVFEKIEPPWFFNTYRMEDVWADQWPGEDMGFSQKCREAGIKMYVDTTVTSPHMIDAAVDESSYRQYLADKGYRSQTLAEIGRDDYGQRDD